MKSRTMPLQREGETMRQVLGCYRTDVTGQTPDKNGLLRTMMPEVLTANTICRELTC